MRQRGWPLSISMTVMRTGALNWERAESGPLLSPSLRLPQAAAHPGEDGVSRPADAPSVPEKRLPPPLSAVAAMVLENKKTDKARPQSQQGSSGSDIDRKSGSAHGQSHFLLRQTYPQEGAPARSLRQRRVSRHAVDRGKVGRGRVDSGAFGLSSAATGDRAAAALAAASPLRSRPRRRRRKKQTSRRPS